MKPIASVLNKKNIAGVIIVLLLVITGYTLWYNKFRLEPFCFNFVHNTQFGDRKVENPSNQGIGTPSGMSYYIPEVPALQTALAREGFYIDPYEATGGRVYYAAFFGPSTQVAVKDFQAKYKLPVTGTVENDTIDILRSLYGCPVIATTTTATTTKE